MKSLSMSPLFDFTPHLEGYSEPYVLGAGTDGTIYCCVAKTDEPRRVVYPNKVSGGKSKFDAPTDYTIFSWDGSQLRDVVLRDEPTVVSEIQPHPEGVLLTSARCLWRPEAVEKNALVVNWDGEVVRRWTFGDGINHVRTSPNGTAYVGYFDEGVYGTYGWRSGRPFPDGRPGGPKPIGYSGVVAFDADGEITWRYDWRRLGRVIIVDVYAMNVVGDDDLWVYYYHDFKIINVKNGEYRTWDPDISWVRAFAIDGDRALLATATRETSSAHILKLEDDGTCSQLEEAELVDETGEPVNHRDCYGVGKDLYVFQRGKVSVLRHW